MGSFTTCTFHEILFLYAPQNILGVIKSRMELTGHVARMGEMRNAYSILVGKAEGERLLGRLGVGRKIVSEWILRKYGGRV